MTQISGRILRVSAWNDGVHGDLREPRSEVDPGRADVEATEPGTPNEALDKLSRHSFANKLVHLKADVVVAESLVDRSDVAAVQCLSKERRADTEWSQSNSVALPAKEVLREHVVEKGHWIHYP
jgi:hypothetical protein